MSKTIYDLKLHESLDVSENQRSESVICKRVAGGWIYSTFSYDEKTGYWICFNSVFVPFNNEFQLEHSGDFKMTAPKEVKAIKLQGFPVMYSEDDYLALKAESEKKDLKIEALQGNNKALSKLNDRLSKSYNFDQANISDLKADLEELVKSVRSMMKTVFLPNKQVTDLEELSEEIGEKWKIKYE